jgi:hypothetical protein
MHEIVERCPASCWLKVGSGKLGAWNSIASRNNITSSGGSAWLSDSATGGAQRFYRIGIRLP